MDDYSIKRPELEVEKLARINMALSIMALRGRRLVELALAENEVSPEVRQSMDREFGIVNIDNNSTTNLNEHTYFVSPKPTTNIENNTSNTVKTKLCQIVNYKELSDSDSPLFSDSDEYNYAPSSDFGEVSSSDEEPKKKRRSKKINKVSLLKHVAVQKVTNYEKQQQIGQEPESSTEKETVVFEQILTGDTQLNTNKDSVVENREGEENRNEARGQEIRGIKQKRKRSRKGLSNPQQWQRQVNKEKRMRGESYKGLKK
ncbi:hypothetical protein J6590_104652 [Homalodisca vitripennis]|nr:hypothetical protein J6590_104652 [Homalodisca vitripennis]